VKFMNASVMRILDANANRAREALRVIEDYARFAIDQQAMAAELKQVRHDLAEATAGFVADAILHRDTPGDVGTGNKTPSERRREDLRHVVTAAGKRLGEALRTMEEYLKTIDAPAAAKLEGLRYRFYDVEHRLAFLLRPVAGSFAGVRLYVLISQSLCRKPWLEVARQAIAGGADCLQLREKELESGELLGRARQLVALCREQKVLCIINDRPDIALLSDADGVHVGQSDLPAREVRRLIGSSKILGVSTHQIEQARQAVRDGADYIGVGPIFPSTTKSRDFLAGLEYAREAASEIARPGVAISGINVRNVDDVLATGVRAVAVSAAVIAADDPRSAAAELKQKLSAGVAAPVAKQHA
jgi:thiamine-phosphate pyrophosphorylase